MSILDPDFPVPAPVPGSCARILLEILQGFLRNDFSEYNSKNYQRETRNALLNLSSYAYDHEVRLAARMVLDYISARFAVTSNDLRRLLPFRRINEPDKSKHNEQGFMEVSLIDWASGADTMAGVFAVLAGNLRVYEKRPGSLDWTLPDSGEDQLQEIAHDYRLPPSIHNLLVNDFDRRYFQRLHRYIGDSRNDNTEIVAGSPSYLITAGGRVLILPSIRTLEENREATLTGSAALRSPLHSCQRPPSFCRRRWSPSAPPELRT